jgi:transcriptional regulator with XRE-family HTH domain
MTSSPLEHSAAQFVALFTRWRTTRGLTKKQLASQMGFDPSYLSHIERGRHRPTADFARRAEVALRAGGALWQAFLEYDEARAAMTRSRANPVPRQWRPPGPGPVVEQELASLAYHHGRYQCVVRRSLYNAGTEPISRWLARIVVDRFPHDPERSRRHHRDHPLSLEQMELYARCGSSLHHEEPMNWRVKQDRDALKEIWLLFENDTGRFPLYPGQRTTIEYGYVVSDQLWGCWFQRAVRLPTGRLAVRLELPLQLRPYVWGTESSLTGEAPLRTPVVQRPAADRAVFEWGTETPPVHARYRLQWRYQFDS